MHSTKHGAELKPFIEIAESNVVTPLAGGELYPEYKQVSEAMTYATPMTISKHSKNIDYW